MSQQSQQDDDDIRALRRIVNEVRAAAPPPVDWERVEAGLLPRVAREAEARRRQLSAVESHWGRLAVFAAAAAAVVVFAAGIAKDTQQPEARRPVLSFSPPVGPEAIAPHELTDIQGEHHALPLYSVRDMRANSVVTSGEEPMRFTLPGVATWTLAPNSKVVVDTIGLPHRLTLVQGSIIADVVPRESSNELVEAFVVEAGTTRVAVHGTVFSVEKLGDRITVEVTRGSVTVGPAGHRGATTGRVLVSPVRADFSLDQGVLLGMRAMSEPAVEAGTIAAAPPVGHPSFPLWGPEPAPATADSADSSPIAHAAPHDPKSGHPADSAAAATPGEPPAPRKLTVDEARAMLVGCLSAGTSGTDTTLVTVSSQVTASLDADGTVTSLRFSPPLRPDLQQRCGSSLFGRAIAGERSVGFQVHFSTH